jgi:CRISPR-associated protein Cmr4
MLGMLAETSVHPGAGRSQGVIDLPVSREAATDFPVIPGTSLKGTLRSKAEHERNLEFAERIFGKQDSAGAVGVTDARLLLLPVRSLTGHSRWITCPYVLERFVRDLSLIGVEKRLPEWEIAKFQSLVAEGEGVLFLEELSFKTVVNRSVIEELSELLASLIRHDSVRNRLPEQLVVLHDDDFTHFARYALPVAARNVLDDKTKKSTNLWYEETLPPDCLFYALFLSRPGKDEELAELKEHLSESIHVQVGGNETVGQGWMITRIVEGAQ